MLERWILKKTERKLRHYRTLLNALDEFVLSEYRNYQPQIESLSSQATHWHGTGRYHYQHDGASRYKDVNLEAINDILVGIVTADGLKTHKDPWIESGGETVSLATTRMHARAFARMHATSESEFVYELGSLKLWIRFYFALLFIWLIGNLWQLRGFIAAQLRTSFSRDIQNWGSAIRKPVNGKVISIRDMLWGNIPTSDITGNYPVLIGVAVTSKKLIETVPLTHKVEQRSLHPIPLTAFTHIEVPREYVVETESLLKKHQIQIPVIPLEFGDMFLANVPLRELAFSAV